MLSADITLQSDGGGKVRALLKPLQGANKVARFLVALRRSKLIPNYVMKLARVNNHAGIVYLLEGRIQNVATFSFLGDRINAIYFIRNPDKLKRIPQNFSQSF